MNNIIILLIRPKLMIKPARPGRVITSKSSFLAPKRERRAVLWHAGAAGRLRPAAERAGRARRLRRDEGRARQPEGWQC